MSYTKLFLSGGGVKGIAHLGALKKLNEEKLLDKVTHYIACSVGTIVSALVISGYEINDIYTFFKIVDFGKLKSSELENPLIDFGADKGDILMDVIDNLIYGKLSIKDPTFNQFYKATGKTFTIATVCANTHEIEYFDHINKPDMLIRKGIRMSIAIPFIFTPVVDEGKYYIDGGMINNYPIDYSLRYPETDKNEILGIVILTKNEIAKIETFEDYVVNVIYSSLESSTMKNIKTFEKETIIISLSKTYSVYLNIDDIDKEDIFNQGYASCTDFLLNKKQ